MVSDVEIRERLKYDHEQANEQSFSAPTPYNTYLSPTALDYTEELGQTSTSTSTGYDAYPQTEGNGPSGGRVSFGPSISIPSHDHDHDHSHSHGHTGDQTHSTNTLGSQSRLIPPGYTFDPTISVIPQSDLPIPSPPSRLSSSDTKSSLVQDLSSSSSATTTSGSRQKGGWTWRGRTKKGKQEMTQDDRDAARLQQLGYDAVLGREYNFWSSLAITTLNIGALQGTVLAVKNTYQYGGPQMILVAWPMSGIFSMFLTLTLSELASAYPVAGAMASWAWKCARGGVGGERKWGWLLGGIVLAGHTAAVVLVTWEICDIISGTMALAMDYTPQTWHSVLFYVAILLTLGCVGMTATGRSHKFWICGGIYGLAIWAILCISVLVAEVRKGGRIQTDRFFNSSGWDSKTYVYLLGWQYSTIASGVDASAHMAEETKNPSRNVPKAMTMSMILTYVLAYISIILMLLSISPEDGEDISKHSFPFGFTLQRAISPHGAIAIICLLIFVLLLQVLAQLQATSRFLFALARDNALPFSASIRRTNKHRVPVIAHWTAILICMPFAFLLIGGLKTLRGVLAVTCSSLAYTGYSIPVILYLLSKKNLQLEGRTSWSLRSLSKPFACVGILFALGVIIVQTLPGSYPVTAKNASWSPLVLASTGLLTVVSWYAYGRKHYSGPIRAVTKWETGVEIDLASTLGPRSTQTNTQRPSGTGTVPVFDSSLSTRAGAGAGGEGHGIGNVEDERDIKRHFVNGVDVMEVPTVTISRAWSLESGSGSGSGSDETGEGTETGTGFQSHPADHGPTTSSTTMETGVHTRRSFENP